MLIRTILDELRPYIENIINDDDIMPDDPNISVTKFWHLTKCIFLSCKYPEILPYLKILIKKFTPEELNGGNFLRTYNYFDNARIIGESIFSRIANHLVNDEVMKMLIEQGADINLPNSQDLPPLASIIEFGNYNYRGIKLIKLYVENGANLNSLFTCRNETHNILSFLLMSNITYDKKGIKVTKYLLKSGAVLKPGKINYFRDNAVILDVIKKYNESLIGKHTKLAQK